MSSFYCNDCLNRLSCALQKGTQKNFRRLLEAEPLSIDIEHGPSPHDNQLHSVRSIMQHPTEVTLKFSMEIEEYNGYLNYYHDLNTLTINFRVHPNNDKSIRPADRLHLYSNDAGIYHLFKDCEQACEYIDRLCKGGFHELMEERKYLAKEARY